MCVEIRIISDFTKYMQRKKFGVTRALWNINDYRQVPRTLNANP